MTNLTHDQEMKLSKLLHPYLDMGCWHELDSLGFCKKCQVGKLLTECPDISTNPNLFLRSAFLDVFDAVKDREDWIERYSTIRNWIPIELVNSPFFQLEVLKWLLEKDGRLGGVGRGDRMKKKLICLVHDRGRKDGPCICGSSRKFIIYGNRVKPLGRYEIIIPHNVVYYPKETP